MKRMLSLLLLLLCSGIRLVAQQPEQFTGALLWKVSGNGLDESSYILGTHHFISENFVDSIPGLQEVMEQAQQTVGELDMSDMPGMQMKILEAGMMPEEESYRILLTEPDYIRLDDKLTELLGAGLEQFGQLKPTVIFTVVSLAIFKQICPEQDVMTHVGIDSYIQQVAQNKGRVTGGLETVDEQIQLLFNSKSLKRQVDELLCTMDNFDRFLEITKELTANYRNANLNQLYADAFDENNDPCFSLMDEKEKQMLLEDRNNSWLDKMPVWMKEGSSLFVVGALHLAGEEGLLFQLSQRGYQVEAVH